MQYGDLVVGGFLLLDAIAMFETDAEREGTGTDCLPVDVPRESVATCDVSSPQGSGKIFVFQVSPLSRRLVILKNQPLSSKWIKFLLLGTECLDEAAEQD